MRLRRRALVAFPLLAVGCGADVGEGVAPGDGATSFISHVPRASSSGADGAGGAASGTALNAAESDDASTDANRAIAEADILQVAGDRLYALSQFSGLSIIDIHDPTSLSLLGTYRASAVPFEMYLEGDTAYVMFNGWSSYVFDEAAGGYQWVTTSRMQALDVSDPSSVRLIGDHEVNGEISDSRKVGDVLYLVTHQSSWCWGCDSVANTRVTSFDVSNPEVLQQVDQVRYETADESWGRRSVSVTPERMYVSGWSWSSDGQQSGTIDVVDITDPAGDLQKGKSVAIAGQIQSRWQMEEENGILRVVSQPGGWGTTNPPVLETFEVTSADSITRLAALDMVLPRPESLRSVRFDGDRAYAVTFEQTDPLFTFDLSDPANPKQVGELEIPGWVYHMEPRGDRIYALGFDNTVARGSLHVSLFDVSDLSTPTMLDRVNFGGDWASFAEDQDRIHKAFNILSDEGLILVPFSGGYSNNECSYEYESGIQLIDMTTDSLTLRGVAPQVGSARRALLHENALFGISDNAVQTFDITDRDAPTKLDRLDVARNVTSIRAMGSTMLRFGSDWWTDQTVLDFTTLDRVSDAQPLGEIDLSEVVGTNDSSCTIDEASQTYAFYNESWGGQVYVHGSYAYVPRYANTWDESGKDIKQQSDLTFHIVDLHDRENPKLVGSFSVEPAVNQESFAGVVQTDSALLVGRSTGYYYYDPETGERSEAEFSYDVIDLSDPVAPEVVSRFQVPSLVAQGGWGYAIGGCTIDLAWGWWGYGYYGDYYSGQNALVSGDIVVSQHEEPVNDGTGRVRYYLDRLDVSDPENPVLLPAVNIPGSVVHFDQDTGRVVTIDYLLEERAAQEWSDCYDNNHSGYFDEADHVCRTYKRRLNSLTLDGDVAKRVSQSLIDGDVWASSVAVSDERVFSLTQEWRENAPPHRTIHTMAFEDDGSLRKLPDVELDTLGYSWWGQLVARDDRAFMAGSNTLTVIDARGDSTPKVQDHDMAGWSCNSLEVRDDTAYCALGQFGVAAFPLD